MREFSEIKKKSPWNTLLEISWKFGVGLLRLWNSGSKIIIGFFLNFEKYWVFLGDWEEDGLCGGRIWNLEEGLGLSWVRFLGRGGKSWIETGAEGDLGEGVAIWRYWKEV